MAVEIARVYDVRGADPANGFLIDRLWPRGLAKADAPFQEWLRDIAPTPDLRKWYSHEVDKYDEFSRRYRLELTTGEPARLLASLRERATSSNIVLLTATKDLEHSSAVVIRDLLRSP
ncbi:MAG TPA: DUF488 family protein [Mycobacteriales bacterium]|jgi:uncharacterized protein YeaO (DUF488 family)|nr:DUF488 family protein [Mycobacteriales bacterium]